MIKLYRLLYHLIKTKGDVNCRVNSDATLQIMPKGTIGVFRVHDIKTCHNLLYVLRHLRKLFLTIHKLGVYGRFTIIYIKDQKVFAKYCSMADNIEWIHKDGKMPWEIHGRK